MELTPEEKKRMPEILDKLKNKQPRSEAEDKILTKAADIFGMTLTRMFDANPSLLAAIRKDCALESARTTREVLDEIRKLALDYTRNDGEYHKQWALCEIAKLAGALEDELPDKDDRGIPD